MAAALPRRARRRTASDRQQRTPTRSEAALRLLLEQETIVWHREYCTGRYWLDFYCPTAKVAIEVDGGSHLGREARVHDAERDGWHAERGIVTHRFSADQVERDGQGVLREIRKLVRMRLGLEEELSAATASAALPDPVRPAASSGPRPSALGLAGGWIGRGRCWSPDCCSPLSWPSQ